MYIILSIITFFVLIKLLSMVAMMWKTNGIYMLPHIIVLILSLFLLSSCEKDEVLNEICVNGDCSAYFTVPYQQDSSGYFHVKLDYSGEHDPYFIIEAYATAVVPEYRYNDTSVVEAEFKGDKTLKVLIANHLNSYEIIPVVQETSIYLSGNSDTLFGRRTVGPIPPSMIGDTLNVNAEIFWDAGMQSKFKNYSLKFIIE